MKKLIKKLKKIDKAIADCMAEIEVKKTLPFYTVFNQEPKRQEDIYALTSLLEGKKSEKLEILTLLEAAIKDEKQQLKSLADASAA